MSGASNQVAGRMLAADDRKYTGNSGADGRGCGYHGEESMYLERLQRLTLAVALVLAMGVIPAHAGPLAVVANFSDPTLLGVTSPPWPGGTVSVIDTATDQQVGSPIKVGANPMAVAITPD